MPYPCKPTGQVLAALVITIIKSVAEAIERRLAKRRGQAGCGCASKKEGGQ